MCGLVNVCARGVCVCSRQRTAAGVAPLPPPCRSGDSTQVWTWQQVPLTIELSQWFLTWTSYIVSLFYVRDSPFLVSFGLTCLFCFFIFMCMCMCMYAHMCQCPWRPERWPKEGLRCPRAVITVSAEPVWAYMGVGNWNWDLLTAKLSLQTIFLVFWREPRVIQGVLKLGM